MARSSRLAGLTAGLGVAFREAERSAPPSPPQPGAEETEMQHLSTEMRSCIEECLRCYFHVLGRAQ